MSYNFKLTNPAKRKADTIVLDIFKNDIGYSCAGSEKFTHDFTIVF